MRIPVQTRWLLARPLRVACAEPHALTTVVPPSPCLSRPAAVRTHELLPDPDGSDTDAELVHSGSTSVDLTGYALGDIRSSARHGFDRAALVPGEAVVVFDHGDHAATPNAVTSSTGTLSLNNAGDRITRFDPWGAIVDQVRYPRSRTGIREACPTDGDASADMVRHDSVSPLASSPGAGLDGTAF